MGRKGLCALAFLAAQGFAGVQTVQAETETSPSQTATGAPPESGNAEVLKRLDEFARWLHERETSLTKDIQELGREREKYQAQLRANDAKEAAQDYIDFDEVVRKQREAESLRDSIKHQRQQFEQVQRALDLAQTEAARGLALTAAESLLSQSAVYTQLAPPQPTFEAIDEQVDRVRKAVANALPGVGDNQKKKAETKAEVIDSIDALLKAVEGDAGRAKQSVLALEQKRPEDSKYEPSLQAARDVHAKLENAAALLRSLSAAVTRSGVVDDTALPLLRAVEAILAVRRDVANKAVGQVTEEERKDGETRRQLATQATSKAAAKPVTLGAKASGAKTDVTLSNGGRLAYGLSVSLLRFSTARRADEPARLRNYSPELQLLPAEFGFQFLYRPSERPWRLKRNDGQDFQLMSWGGVLLAQIDNQRFERGGLSVAATLGFFEDTVGFGMGFDLYRGIPVASPVGDEKGGTAYTGVLAWGLARDGEVTPENVFAVVTLNLAQLAGRVTGEAQ